MFDANVIQIGSAFWTHKKLKTPLVYVSEIKCLNLLILILFTETVCSLIYSGVAEESAKDAKLSNINNELQE